MHLQPTVFEAWTAEWFFRHRQREKDSSAVACNAISFNACIINPITTVLVILTHFSCEISTVELGVVFTSLYWFIWQFPFLSNARQQSEKPSPPNYLLNLTELLHHSSNYIQKQVFMMLHETMTSWLSLRRNRNQKANDYQGINSSKARPDIIKILTFKHGSNMQIVKQNTGISERCTLEGGSVSLGLDISGNLVT